MLSPPTVSTPGHTANGRLRHEEGPITGRGGFMNPGIWLLSTGGSISRGAMELESVRPTPGPRSRGYLLAFVISTREAKQAPRQRGSGSRPISVAALSNLGRSPDAPQGVGPYLQERFPLEPWRPQPAVGTQRAGRPARRGTMYLLRCLRRFRLLGLAACLATGVSLAGATASGSEPGANAVTVWNANAGEAAIAACPSVAMRRWRHACTQ